MYFVLVTARAFGPLSQKKMEFAPGMNVVWGPNEAGKSSWHAAVFAGLCGIRRGPGRSSRETSDFADRHRPWEGEEWAVGSIVVLADGRRVELRHDLQNRVDCQAIDASMGRDYSAEIMHEGAPDGARWLGLDRRSFAATACIRQSQMLSVREEQEPLQEYLQRAAATSRGDSTAAQALETLAAFQTECVGLDRANSTKPLRKAMNQLQVCQQALDGARTSHRSYTEQAERADQLEETAKLTRDDLAMFRARHAEVEAGDWQCRLSRVQELTERHSEGAPRSMGVDYQLVQTVAAALQAWDERPGIQSLSGLTSDELRRQLQASRDRSERSEAQDITDGIKEGRPNSAKSTGHGRKWGLIAAGVILAAGVVGLAAGLTSVGLIMASVGGGLLVWVLTRKSHEAQVVISKDAERQTLEDALLTRQQAESMVRDAGQKRERAEAGLREAASACGLAGDSGDQLEELLRSWQRSRSDEARLLEQAHEEWAELQTLLGGGTLEELVAEAERRRRVARDQAAGIAPAAITGMTPDVDVAGHRKMLEDAASNTDGEAQKARGEISEREKTLPSVAEAEEALITTEAELETVRKLSKTLTDTQHFLERAQERVHRDIAPVLADSVRRWLPDVTAGRYTDVLVDPQSLEVKVRGGTGQWRIAERLSHGTAEQIYLLLRVAMAEHLTARGEICPLLLDDVTSQSDAERKIAVLETLRVLSADRQVILFSQEQEVLEWAEANLRPPEGRLKRLDPAAAPS